MPSISVIMSVYNGEEYIADSIKSILNQTFSDFEFLIIDDGSTDKTLTIINDFVDNRIKLIRNEINIGLPASLNKGIKLATGKYIARQDADDISEENRLEKQFNYAESNNVDLLGSASYNIDMDGNILSLSLFNDFEKFDSEDLLFEKRMLFAHGTAFIRRETLLEVGLYNEGFYYAQDAELWMRFVKLGKRIHYINEPLYYLRRLPLASDKKVVGQRMYMDCLKKNYSPSVISKGELEFKLEIDKTNEFLKKRVIVNYNNYMSMYWHYCSTTCLVESRDRKRALKYIGKALKERKTFFQLISHLLVVLAIPLPYGLFKLGINKKESLII